jgi:parvulin-like peptidyl-prolyl isomerase
MKQQMISKFLQKDFESKLKVEDVPDADVEKYYKEHPAEFNQKDEVRVSEVVVKEKGKADKAYAEARTLPKGPAPVGPETKQFKDIVTKYADDEETKQRGGDLGFFDKDSTRYPKEVVEASFKLAEVGDVAAPIKTEKGLRRHPADAEASRLQPAAGRGQAPDPAAPFPRHAHEGDGQLRRRAEEEERDRGQRQQPGQGRHRHGRGRGRTGRTGRPGGADGPAGDDARAAGSAGDAAAARDTGHASCSAGQAVTGRRVLLTGVLCLAGATVVARGADARMVEKIAAVVGENVVLASEVEEKAGPLMSDISKVTDSDKRAARASSLRREVLERLIDDELILQQAAELKLTVTSDQVDSSIAEIKKQNNIDDDQLREALRAQGMSMANYRADLKRQLLRFRVLNIAVGSRVNVSDEEVKAYYERHMKGSANTQVRASHIFVAIPDGADRAVVGEKQAQANKILERAKTETSPSSRARCPMTPPRGQRAATSVSSARTCCRSRSRSWCSR